MVWEYLSCSMEMNTEESEIATKHRQELVASGLEAYRLLEVVEPTALKGKWESEFFRHGIALVDALVAEEIHVDKSAVESMASLSKLDAPDAQKAWECLSLTVQSVRPARRVMRLVLTCFCQWMETVGDGRRGALFLHLPTLGSAFALVDGKSVDRIIGDVLALPSAKATVYLEIVAKYAHSSKDIVLSVCRFARKAVEWEREELLGKLVDAMPPDTVLGDTDAMHFIPTVVAALDECSRTGGKLLWDASAGLLLTIGKLDHSSGFFAAKLLPRSLLRVGNVEKASYVEDFGVLVESVGIRTVGFALRELPGLYKEYGVDRVHRFVAVTRKIAATSGRSAAVGFLERRTAVARTMLPFAR